MKRGMLSGIVIAVLAVQATASFEELELGPESRAMGGTGVVMPGLPGILWNPASISFAEKPGVFIAGRLPFSLADFATAGADIAFKAGGNWSFGSGARWFGGELYSEQTLHATASLLLSSDLAVGIQPILCRASISDGASSYGSAVTVDMAVGIQAAVYERWSLGACLRNPLEARIGSSGEHLANRMDIGVRYEPIPGMATAFAVSRDFRGTGIRAGQALPLGPMTIFAGARSNPASVTGGFSARVRGLEFSYAIETHPQLNPTHQAGVGYAF